MSVEWPLCRAYTPLWPSHAHPPKLLSEWFGACWATEWQMSRALCSGLTSGKTVGCSSSSCLYPAEPCALLWLDLMYLFLL